MEPRMIEGDIFKTIVPLDDTYSSSITMNGKATIKTVKRYEQIIEVLGNNRNRRHKMK